ncbi:MULTISPECIES: DUF6383 domain-containing protein [unclassified Parabacteroides]|uniref:DUF6383 domain-containing protein n=1 Tax=unclassified Parabacteroides TaxID=2649774 RepID=UPI002473F536|nr:MULTISPECIES: DUF6383 domain-containing protein [unclassified Parabacteroides]
MKKNIYFLIVGIFVSLFFAENAYAQEVPKYRRLDGGQYGQVTEYFGDATNSPLWLKMEIFDGAGYRYLFENSPYYSKDNNYRDSLNNKNISFVGVENSSSYSESNDFSYTFFIDTAYVRNGTEMPQYMIAVRPDIIKIGNTQLVRAMWMFNSQDSIDAGNKDYETKLSYFSEKQTRMAFVDGVHLGDTFYVIRSNSPVYALAAKDIIPELLYESINEDDKHYLGENIRYGSKQKDNSISRKSMVFQFRLYAKDYNRVFMIESTFDDEKDEPEIALRKGHFLAQKNHLPIMTDKIDMETAKMSAELFDFEQGTEYNAVDAEKPSVRKNTNIYTQNGGIIIKNAEGKRVIISNILGQQITNRQILSDNYFIPLSPGIAIVFVEGESATKVAVKP